jgi:hypothetical protein
VENEKKTQGDINGLVGCELLARRGMTAADVAREATKQSQGRRDRHEIRKKILVSSRVF